MIKAKQKETALYKIERRICNMSNTQDLQCLEEYDASISAMIRLTWQLEIISKQERNDLEIKVMEMYFMQKNKLKSIKEAKTA